MLPSLVSFLVFEGLGVKASKFIFNLPSCQCPGNCLIIFPREIIYFSLLSSLHLLGRLNHPSDTPPSVKLCQFLSSSILYHSFHHYPLVQNSLLIYTNASILSSVFIISSQELILLFRLLSGQGDRTIGTNLTLRRSQAIQYLTSCNSFSYKLLLKGQFE